MCEQTALTLACSSKMASQPDSPIQDSNLQSQVDKHIEYMGSSLKTVPAEKNVTPKSKSGANPAIINRPIKKRCRIKINNSSNSLFLALQAAYVYATGGLTDQRFYDYLHGKGFRMYNRLNKEMLELKAAVGAPEQYEAYDTKLWIYKVINYWNNNNTDGNKFCAFVFKPNCLKPFYKYGPENYDIPIILYYDEERQHFDGVQKVGFLFGRPYCLACECCYRTSKEHTNDCRARCIKCSRMKQGQPPCPPIPGYSKKCDDCNKTFFSDVCYAYHKEKNFCARSKQCVKCGVIWNIRNPKRNVHACRKNKILS